MLVGVSGNRAGIGDDATSEVDVRPSVDELALERREGVRTHLQRRLIQVVLLVFAAEALLIAFVSVAAWFARGLWALKDTGIDPAVLSGPPVLAFWLIGLWSFFLFAFGAYDRRRFGSGFGEFRAMTVGTLTAFLTMGCSAYLLKSQLPRGFLILAFVIGLPSLVILRFAERKAFHARRAAGSLVIRTIAVGSPTAVAELATVLGRERWAGYKVLGMCGDSAAPGVPLLGSLSDLPLIAVEEDADAVLVAGGSYGSAADLRRLGWALEGLDIQMLVVPSLLDIAGPRIRFDHVAGLPLVHVEEPRIDRAMGFAKRGFDILAASMLLFFGLLPMALVGLVIKLNDGGPVFYRQRRVGRHGREFMMYKFRSMHVNADSIRSDLDEHNEHDGVLFKIRNDPRITKIGKHIRRFSVDEVPQLLNVVRGEMSLVGPRPPLPDEVARYDADVHRRLFVRPGITGLWQVSGRSDLSWDESVRLDLYYVDNWSLVSDVMILLKTIKAVVISRGAY